MPVDPVEKDTFCGEEAVRHFSARLAAGLDEELPDADIAAVLGDGSVAPFRYAKERLQGFIRRTTGEPAFCHSADIALRAVDLGYPAAVIRLALLHDTVEDRSKTLEEIVANLDEISNRFGVDAARDLRVSTNAYSVIIRGMERHTPAWLPFSDESKEPLKKALNAYAQSQSPAMQTRFRREFDRLHDYFVPRIDLTGGERKARVDKKYTVISELRLQSYRLFVEDIHDDARFRIKPEGSGFYEVPLVVKTLDLVDNLRTSEVSNFGSLERILLKVETFLDCCFFLHETIRALGRQDSTTFIDLYDYLKYHLIEQLMERKRAMVYLADTRFACLADYLMREVLRLQEKYQATGSPVARLAELRTRIRTLNEGAAVRQG